MGLVLDSSVLIVAEREAKPVSSVLAALQQHGENDIVLSAITMVELEHGLHRAQTAEQTQKRRDYLDEVLRRFRSRASTERWRRSRRKWTPMREKSGR